MNFWDSDDSGPFCLQGDALSTDPNQLEHAVVFLISFVSHCDIIFG